MKKYICLILSCIMLLTLCACGNGNSVEPDNTNHTQSTVSNMSTQTVKVPALTTEPTAPPATESIPAPTDSEVIPDDPGDIGHGGAPEVNHTHSYTAAGIQNPTCTNPGYTVYTCYCGDAYMYDFTDPSGHAYEDTVVAPTAESEGYTEHTCWKCLDSYRDNYTDKLPS